MNISQAWYILQANALGGSQIIGGPFYAIAAAMAGCKDVAESNPGVPYIVVTTVNGLVAKPPDPQPDLVAVPLQIIP